jgi:transposase
MKISDIIPFINEGKTNKQIAIHFNLSIPTIVRYKKILREKGFQFTTKNGRPFKAI